MKKGILVTGGAGFIGSNLVRELSRRYFNHEVVVVDNLTYAADMKNLEGIKHKFYQYNIRSKSLMKQLFQDHDFEYVYHLAAESHVDKSINGPEVFFETNVLGTQNLYQSILDSGKMPKAIINVSTDEVYGDIKFADKRGMFYPDNRIDPTSPYAASKASQDMVAKSYYKTYGMPIITTRCSNNFGPRQDKTKFIPKAIDAILNNKELPLYNNGKNERDWLWVYDHVEGLISAAEIGKPGSVYLFGTGHSRSNLDVLGALTTIINQPVKLKHVEDRKAHDEVYRVCHDTAFTDLEWTPSIGFETGLKKTVHWYINNPWSLM